MEQHALTSSLYIPTEVCERIIDVVAIYYDGYPLSPIGVTLQHCALVCRAWRPRAQNWLFEYIRVTDVESLQRLSKVFHDAPEFTTRVSRMALLCRYKTGTLHNVLCRFPTVVPYTFPSLREVMLWGSYQVRDSRIHPKLSIYIPMPPRFRILFSPMMTNVTYLYISDITFSSFTEFADLLSCFPSLEQMTCMNIIWAIASRFPPCMSVKDETSGRKPFLALLRILKVHTFSTARYICVVD